MRKDAKTKIGWIDFSKSDREKVMDVLSLLSEKGTLDELGIAPVRDAFSDLFFPGTSTNHTAAKYFFVVPYALKDIEKSGEINHNKALRVFYETEKECCRIFGNTDGVIGRRTLKWNSWTKNPPSAIYWAALRRYGILQGEKASLTEYVRSVCSSKSERYNNALLGNNEAMGEMSELDDTDAGRGYSTVRVNMPLYRQGWMKADDFTFDLTRAEGCFLKERIIESCPDSMLGYVLKHNITAFCDVESFEGLEDIIHLFPPGMQQDYYMAKDISDFVYVTRVVYNLIVSGSDKQIEDYGVKPSEIAQKVDIGEIFARFKIMNPSLRRFLSLASDCMKAGDTEGLKDAVVKRERALKTTRARCTHPGEYNDGRWYCGERLEYRFDKAKRIVKDIFKSEGLTDA